MLEEHSTQKQNKTRYLWLLLGGVSFILGTVGAFLPILPTVPFYMLTVFALGKGSTYWQRKFVESHWYKDYVKEFIEERTLTLQAKCTVIASLSIMMGIGFYFMHSLWARAVLAIVWLGHVIYLSVYIPTKKKL